MKCINCGTENADGTNFCAGCGSPLTQTNNVQPQANVNNQQFGTFDPNAQMNNGGNVQPQTNVNNQQFGTFDPNTQVNGGYAQPNTGYAQPQANVNNQQFGTFDPNTQANNGGYAQPNNTQQNQGVFDNEDKANVGLCIVSFLIPLVGLILFFTNSDKPKAKKAYLICALIPIILSVLLFVGIFVFSAVIIGAAIDEVDSYTTTTTPIVASSGYHIGDPVTLLDGSEWHVIEQNGNNIILFSDVLVKDATGYGKDAEEESQLYENSLVKEYLEGEYLTSLKSGLSNGDTTNLKVRALTLSEYFKYTEQDMSTAWGEYTSCFYSLSSSGKYSYYHDKKFMNKDYDSNFNTIYVDTVTDADKFHGMVSMTSGNYWLGSSVKDRVGCVQDDTLTYYGAYYVKTYGGITSEYVFPSYNLATDMEAVKGNTSGKFLGEATIVGIRPVLETTVKNIKK